MQNIKLYQKLLWIPKAIPDNTIRGYSIPLIKIDFSENHKDRPFLFWSLLGCTKENEPPLLPYIPISFSNAWLEDFIHDWNIVNGKLKYNSGSEGNHWVLLEFKNPVSKYYRKS
jgi:hypothetical protein